MSANKHFIILNSYMTQTFHLFHFESQTFSFFQGDRTSVPTTLSRLSTHFDSTPFDIPSARYIYLLSGIF